MGKIFDGICGDLARAAGGMMLNGQFEPASGRSSPDLACPYRMAFVSS